MIIAIDGPSASGKGTIGRTLANHYRFAFLDTGLLFRVVAKACIDRGVAFDQVDEIIALMPSLQFHDLDASLYRSEDISQGASAVAVIPEVREHLMLMIRKFAYNPPPPARGSVIDGRDIGTIVCPEAYAKLFITATPEVRAERRLLELKERGHQVTLNEMIQKIRDRDERDENRAEAPLKRASDSFLLDTTSLSKEQSVLRAINYIDSLDARNEGES